MRVVVPFAAGNPKTRLASLLDKHEREQFAHVMLGDVLHAIQNTGNEPEVLSTESIPVEPSVPVIVDERSLSDAVNGELAPPVSIVMADLALATDDALEGLFDAEGDVVIAPGRGGGTNALVVRHPDFYVDYHGCSFRDHETIAETVGASVTVVDSYRLGTDVDEPDDLVEIILHGRGQTADWLVDHGFELHASNGRVRVHRS